MSSEDVCDVWLDMLETYQKRLEAGMECKIEHLGIDRFLKYAIAMMKGFNDLVLGSLELSGMNMLTILNFSDLILDPRLFTTLVDNVNRLTDAAERRKQANIFYLIFEVIEFKRRFYKASATDSDDKKELIRGRLTMLDKQQELYQKRMTDEFADCEDVVEWCQKSIEFWNGE